MERGGSALRREASRVAGVRGGALVRSAAARRLRRPALPAARRSPRNVAGTAVAAAGRRPAGRRAGAAGRRRWPIRRSMTCRRRATRAMLTDVEQQKLEDDLVAARDQQQVGRRRRQPRKPAPPRPQGKQTPSQHRRRSRRRPTPAVQQPARSTRRRPAAMLKVCIEVAGLTEDPRAFERLRRWKSSTASGACRPTCSSRSTAPRRPPATPAPTSSISAWAIRTCRRPPHVIEKLKETLGKPRTDRYSASKGIPGPAPRAGRLLRAPLRREAQSRHPDRHHARLQGRLRQRRAGDHRAGRRRAGARPELSDPRLRLPDGGRRDPLGAVGADAGFLRDARARDHALDPEADRGRGLLSVESDRLCRRSRLLQGAGAVREEARHLHPVRSRLCRGLFRQQSAAVGAAGAGRDGCRGRVHLDVEDLSRCRAGASALRSATSASSRRWRG